MTGITLVADENIALSAIKALRERGYSLLSVAEQLPGGADEDVLRYAYDAGAALPTFDRDYGELIFKRGHRAPHSVIYLRSIPVSPAETIEIIEGLLSGRQAGEVAGYFVVWTREGTRKRAFPPLVLNGQ